MSPQGGDRAGHEGGLGAGHRHRAGARRRCSSRWPSSAASPAASTSSSRSPSPSRCCSRRSTRSRSPRRSASLLLKPRSEAVRSCSAVLRLVQPRSSAGSPTATSRSPAILVRQGVPEQRCSSACVAVLRGRHRHAASPAASCPTRTTATSSSTSSSPTPRRSSGPTRWRRGRGDHRRKTTGVEYYTTITGYSMLSRRVRLEHGVLLRVAEALGGAQGEGGARFELIGALNKKLAAASPRRAAFAFGPPAIPGLGTGSAASRIMLQDRSGRTPEELAGRRREVHRGGAEAPGDRLAPAPSSAPRCRRSSPTSTATR